MTVRELLRGILVVASVGVCGCTGTRHDTPSDEEPHAAFGMSGTESLPLAGQEILGAAIGRVEFGEGRAQGYFESGTKAYSVPLDSEGLLDGVGEWWYPNGVLAERTRYSGGRMHGRCQLWAADGSLISDEVWYMGVRLPQDERGSAGAD